MRQCDFCGKDMPVCDCGECNNLASFCSEDCAISFANEKNNGKGKAARIFISICDGEDEPARSIVLNLPSNFNFTVDEVEKFLAIHMANMAQEMNAMSLPLVSGKMN